MAAKGAMSKGGSRQNERQFDEAARAQAQLSNEQASALQRLLPLMESGTRNEQAYASRLLEQSEPRMREAMNIYEGLATGDLEKSQPFLGPLQGQIATRGQRAREQLYETMPRGGQLNAALAGQTMETERAIEELPLQLRESSLANLARMSTTGYQTGMAGLVPINPVNMGGPGLGALQESIKRGREDQAGWGQTAGQIAGMIAKMAMMA